MEQSIKKTILNRSPEETHEALSDIGNSLAVGAYFKTLRAKREEASEVKIRETPGRAFLDWSRRGVVDQIRIHFGVMVHESSIIRFEKGYNGTARRVPFMPYLRVGLTMAKVIGRFDIDGKDVDFSCDIVNDMFALYNNADLTPDDGMMKAFSRWNAIQVRLSLMRRGIVTADHHTLSNMEQRVVAAMRGDSRLESQILALVDLGTGDR